MRSRHPLQVYMYFKNKKIIVAQIFLNTLKFQATRLHNWCKDIANPWIFRVISKTPLCSPAGSVATPWCATFNVGQCVRSFRHFKWRVSKCLLCSTFLHITHLFLHRYMQFHRKFSPSLQLFSALRCFMFTGWFKGACVKWTRSEKSLEQVWEQPTVLSSLCWANRKLLQTPLPGFSLPGFSHVPLFWIGESHFATLPSKAFFFSSHDMRLSLSAPYRNL